MIARNYVNRVRAHNWGDVFRVRGNARETLLSRVSLSSSGETDAAETGRERRER